jgi:Kelch motif
VFGGHDLPVSNPACQRTSSIEKYSPSTDTWTLIANLDVPRDSIGVGVLGNFIVVIGQLCYFFCVEIMIFSHFFFFSSLTDSLL